MKPVKILVTGERNKEKLPATLGEGRPAIEWTELPVLDFEAIPLPDDTLEALATNPVDWILFTSVRGVRFWGEAWISAGQDFPTETRVACIGETTAVAATQDGFDADFVPSVPGSETFLAEFEELLSTVGRKPRIVIPMAEGGRTKIAERLKQLGCLVQVIPLYRTCAKDLTNALTPETIDSLNGLLFTSPSSVEAFLSYFTVPPTAQVFAIGSFTEHSLLEHGLAQAKVIPGGDLSRIGEVFK